MTLQDLKDNKSEIITKITNLVGEVNVKATMATMIGGLDCCDSIDELIESSISINEFKLENKFSKKDSILVQMHASAHIDEKYNIITKEYNKI